MRARRRAALIVLVGTAIGAGLLVAARHWMPRIPADRAPLVLALFGVFAVVPLLAISAYLWRLGARAIDDDRVPPAGPAAIHPGAVLVGLSAPRRARLCQVFAVFFGGAALILAVLIWRLSHLLPAR